MAAMHGSTEKMKVANEILEKIFDDISDRIEIRSAPGPEYHPILSAYWDDDTQKFCIDITLGVQKR
jgi:hypothetical protein